MADEFTVVSRPSSGEMRDRFEVTRELGTVKPPPVRTR
ncbi:hypothetical protein SAMN05421805_106279 [Saccharopolyspora antimicrobica]|uniref:Uncharacterized protein n=1 Tax=Saccharopolyspora antimicrobica TaxID=455193 RepID=A0A1I5BJF4_9PSEU|nr:hypothetical protein ATL45_5004 [Saccharopolyspora antimicrobica]SFN74719.1 hypothetical protein SAMN05421805_106279 [Saccharopolyspora antimicrobica]